MAGRKAAISLNDQLLVYECYKDKLFENSHLVPLSNKIFEQISTELQQKFNVTFTSRAVYLSIKRNSDKLIGESGINVSLKQKDSTDESSLDCSMSSNKETNKVYEIKKDDSFDFLKPVKKVVGKKNVRSKKVLNPGWADELARIVFTETKMECNLIFSSRGYFHDEFLCKGHCRECDAEMTISTENNFCKIVINVVIGKLNVVHESKRRLGGKYKERVVEDLKTKNAVKVYELMCSAEITSDGIEPSHLPSHNAVKQHAYRMNLNKNVAADPLSGIIELSNDVFYGPSIVKIGLKSFYVFYWTKLQIEWYRQYAKTERVILSIDATGKIVGALSKDLSNKHIFLYTIMARPENGKSIPVAQMFSQDHSSLFISYWLGLFKTQFVKAPKEVVVDDSSALAKSIITTFSKCESTNHYINMCVAFLEQKSKSLPEFYFRLDRSHIIKNILRSNILPTLDIRLKTFYKRVFGCLILCRKWDEVKKIVADMFTVLLNPFNGTKDFPAELSNENLRKLIRTHNFDDIDTESLNDDEDELESEHTEQELDGVNLDIHWIMDIIKRIRIVEDTSENEAYRRDNAYFYPAAKDYFVGLLKNIVCWGNVMMDSFHSTIVSPTSSNTESYFNKVKHSYKEKRGLERPDNFLKGHLDCIDGNLKKGISNQRKERMAENCKKDVDECSESVPLLGMKTANDEEVAGLTRAEFANETEMEPEEELYEDWGGLSKKNISRRIKGKAYDPQSGSSDQTTTRRAKSSILNPQPDYNENVQNVKIQLLQNGHINRRLKNPIYAINTCAIDSVIHVFIAIFRDCPEVEKIINNSQNCSLSHFIRIFSMEGVTENLYNFRTELMQLIGNKTEKCDNNLTVVNGSCNLDLIFKKLVFRTFSSNLRTECTLCDNVVIRNFGYMPCNGTEITVKGISSIPDLISSKLRKMAEKACKECDKGFKYPKLNLSNVIFIDMEDNSFDKKEDPKYAIDELPQRIIIESSLYRLKGVFEYIATSNANSDGHYRSHCFREACFWEVYDDLEKKPARSNTSDKIIIHTIIYVKIA